MGWGCILIGSGGGVHTYIRPQTPNTQPHTYLHTHGPTYLRNEVLMARRVQQGHNAVGQFDALVRNLHRHAVGALLAVFGVFLIGEVGVGSVGCWGWEVWPMCHICGGCGCWGSKAPVHSYTSTNAPVLVHEPGQVEGGLAHLPRLPLVLAHLSLAHQARGHQHLNK